MEEEPNTSFSSEKDTPEMIPEKENNSEVPMDQTQTPTESADPSATESTAEAESETQLRLFVTLLTARVMTKCHALQNRSQEEWVSHTKRLVNQTMEGLTVTEGFCPDVKRIKKVCKAVLKDLQKKFCGKRLLDSVILLQDPVVDAVIVQSLQAHITELFAKMAKKDSSRCLWKDVLQVVAFAASILVAFFLMALIP